jgi:hypothetical protein
MSQRPGKSTTPKVTFANDPTNIPASSKPKVRLDKNFAKIFSTFVLCATVSVVWRYLQPQSELAVVFSRISQSLFYLSAGSAHFRVWISFSIIILIFICSLFILFL